MIDWAIDMANLTEKTYYEISEPIFDEQGKISKLILEHVFQYEDHGDYSHTDVVYPYPAPFDAYGTFYLGYILQTPMLCSYFDSIDKYYYVECLVHSDKIFIYEIMQKNVVPFVEAILTHKSL